MVITGIIMKPPKEIKYVLVKCNSFIKSPKQMKGCIFIIYIQVHMTEINK